FVASPSSDARVLDPLRQQLVRGAAAGVAALSRAPRRIPVHVRQTPADAVRAGGELSIGRALAGNVAGVLHARYAGAREAVVALALELGVREADDRRGARRVGAARRARRQTALEAHRAVPPDVRAMHGGIEQRLLDVQGAAEDGVTREGE